MAFLDPAKDLAIARERFTLPRRGRVVVIRGVTVLEHGRFLDIYGDGTSAELVVEALRAVALATVEDEDGNPLLDETTVDLFSETDLGAIGNKALELSGIGAPGGEGDPVQQKKGG